MWSSGGCHCARRRPVLPMRPHALRAYRRLQVEARSQPREPEADGAAAPPSPKHAPKPPRGHAAQQAPEPAAAAPAGPAPCAGLALAFTSLDGQQQALEQRAAQEVAHADGCAGSSPQSSWRAGTAHSGPRHGRRH